MNFLSIHGKGRLKKFSDGLFVWFGLFRHHQILNQHVLENKSEYAESQHEKQHNHTELARFGFFAQIPNDETQKNHQTGQTYL